MEIAKCVELRRKLVSDISHWFKNEGGCPDGPAVIGISGGKDSTVVAALCTEALGSDRVIGVLMPNGDQLDISDSYEVVKALGIKSKVVNIEGAFNSIINTPDIFPSYENDTEAYNRIGQSLTNIPPRLRMTVLYTIAQSYGGRVMNTCNLSETIIGWETRWGDSVGDYAPLAELTKTEVVELGLTFSYLPIQSESSQLKIPSSLIQKTPSDGLCGATDEEKFGFTYEELDNFIRYKKTGPNFSKIIERIKNSNFKRKPIPCFKYEGVNNYADIIASVF